MHLVFNFHFKGLKLKKEYCILEVQRERAIYVDTGKNLELIPSVNN